MRFSCSDRLLSRRAQRASLLFIFDIGSGNQLTRLGPRPSKTRTLVCRLWNSADHLQKVGLTGMTQPIQDMRHFCYWPCLAVKKALAFVAAYGSQELLLRLSLNAFCRNRHA